MRAVLALTLLPVLASAQTSSNDCPVTPGAPGHPGDFSLCWSDPRIKVGREETIRKLKDPGSYKFGKYGNPLSGVLMNTKTHHERLLLNRARLFAEINPLDTAQDAGKKLDGFLDLAGRAWDVRGDFIQGTEGSDAWYHVTGDGTRFAFTPIERPEPKRETKEAAETTYEERRQIGIDRLIEANPGLTVEGRRITLPEGMTRDDLDKDSRELYDGIRQSFMGEALEELKQKLQSEPAPKGRQDVYCYQENGDFEMIFILLVPDDPGSNDLIKKGCESPVPHGSF